MPSDHLDTKKIRRDFPLLSSRVNGKPLIYLDNAATTHKPRKVIDALSRFYKTANSNVHRGAHTLSREATNEFEAVREELAGFIGASHSCELIWTSGATEAANLVAQSYGKSALKPGDVILVSEMEHHANIVPWQVVAEQTQANIIPIPITQSHGIDLEQYQTLLNQHQPKIVAFTHVSNALGTINPVKKMTALAKEVGSTVVIDGAQAIAHEPLDVKELDCDFYFFSAHKCYGPTALGALWGRKALLEAMPPWKTGGEMIERVSFAGTTYNQLPFKFEAGTPPIAEVIAFGEALRYLNSQDRTAIQTHEQYLRKICIKKLKAIGGLRIYAEDTDNVGIISFDLPDLHHQDIAVLLDQEGIAIRTGHHCAMPLMETLGCSGTLRTSFSLYNTEDEVTQFCEILEQAVATLRSTNFEELEDSADQQELEFVSPEPYEKLRDELASIGNWQERMAHLMKLGSQLQGMPKTYRTDQYKVSGCESNLWLVTRQDSDQRMHVAAHSDSRIMRGLTYLIISRISNQPIENIKKIESQKILAECKLDQFLSASRTSGVKALLGALQVNAIQAS